MPKKRPRSHADEPNEMGTGPGAVALSPSQELDAFWIDAFNMGAVRRGRRRQRGAAGGKWMVFLARERIDEMWHTIRSATEAGTLGPAAKVSTARPNPNSADPSKHVIIIYTDDADDEGDIREVRAALRELGITWKIPYKTDVATHEGKYQVRGDTRISKLYE